MKEESPLRKSPIFTSTTLAYTEGRIPEDKRLLRKGWHDEVTVAHLTDPIWLMLKDTGTKERDGSFFRYTLAILLGYHRLKQTTHLNYVHKNTLKMPSGRDICQERVP